MCVALLESAYEACLAHELRARGMKVERQRVLPVRYEGVFVEAGCRLDLLDDDRIVIEVKAVRDVAPIHEVQLFTYLKLTNCHLGLNLNFNRRRLKEGITRVVGDFPD